MLNTYLYLGACPFQLEKNTKQYKKKLKVENKTIDHLDIPKLGNSLEIRWKFVGNSLEIRWKLFGNSLEIRWKFFGNSLEIVEFLWKSLWKLHVEMIWKCQNLASYQRFGERVFFIPVRLAGNSDFSKSLFTLDELANYSFVSVAPFIE